MSDTSGPPSQWKKRRRFAIGGDAQTKNRPILPKIPEVYEVVVNENGLVKRYLLPIKDIPPFKLGVDVLENNNNNVTENTKSAENQCGDVHDSNRDDAEESIQKPQPIFKIGFLKKQDVRNNILVTSHVIRVSETCHSQKVLTHHTTPEAKLQDIILHHQLSSAGHDHSGPELSDREREDLIKNLIGATSGVGFNEYVADANAQLQLMNVSKETQQQFKQRMIAPKYNAHLVVSEQSINNPNERSLRSNTTTTHELNNIQKSVPVCGSKRPRFNPPPESPTRARVVGTLNYLPADNGFQQSSSQNSQPAPPQMNPEIDIFHAQQDNLLRLMNVQKGDYILSPIKPAQLQRSQLVESRNITRVSPGNADGLLNLQHLVNLNPSQDNNNVEREHRIRRLKQDIQKHLKVADSLRRDSLIERMQSKQQTHTD